MVLSFDEMHCKEMPFAEIKSIAVNNPKDVFAHRDGCELYNREVNTWRRKLLPLCVLLFSLTLICCSTKPKDKADLDKSRLKTNDLLKKYNAIELIATSRINYSHSLTLQYKDKLVLLQNVNIIDVFETKEKFYLTAEYATDYTYYLNIEIPSEKVSELIHCGKLDNIVVRAHSFKKIDIEYFADFQTDYYQVGEDESGNDQYQEDTYPVIKIEASESYIFRGQLVTFECGVD